jgi:hypothetical protein
MYCIRCGKEHPHLLCDRCLVAKQEYVAAYAEASAAGVPMGYGDLRNRDRDVADIAEALERRGQCT